MSEARWRLFVGENGSAFNTAEPEMALAEFPPPLHGIASYLRQNPDAVSVEITHETNGERSHVLLRRIDDAQMTPKQMWESHWTRPWREGQ